MIAKIFMILTVTLSAVVAQNYIQCGQQFLSLDCNYDCIQEHNATGGACNANNICVCRWPGEDNLVPPPGYVYNSTTIGINKFPLQQCQIDDRNSTGFQYTAFQQFCNFDCRCSHGADSGTCDFNAHYCHCNYNDAVTFNQVNNPSCPICTIDSLVTVLNTTVNLCNIQPISLGCALATASLGSTLQSLQCPLPPSN